MPSKKSPKKKIIIWSIVGLLIVGIIVAIATTPKTESYDQETAKTQDLSTYYSFTGTIESKDSQAVVTDATEQIKTVHIKKGDNVKKDDKLFTTSDGSVYQSTLSGEITSVSAMEGVAYVAGTELATIVDFDHLQVAIKVDEYDVGSVSVDKDVSVYVNALSKSFDGKITEVSKQATTEQGVSYFTATASLPTDENLRIGMSADVKLLHQSAPGAVTLSMKALQFDSDNKPFVYFRDEKGNVATKSVSVGINDGTSVQITSGVVEGETVLLPKKTSDSSSFESFTSNQSK